MSLQENMAASIRAIMKNRHKSLSEFSAELGISRNALYNYLRGRGNPSIATLEHMAKNLGVSPAALMLGVFDTDRRQVMLTLLQPSRCPHRSQKFWYSRSRVELHWGQTGKAPPAG